MTQRTRKIACFSAILVFVGLGLALLAFVDPHWGRGLFGLLFFAGYFGTLLGETSLAALWCALGPGSLSRRLPLAAVWLASIVLAHGCNFSIPWSMYDADPVSSTGVMALFQWAMIAGPLWALADWRGLRIGDQEAHDSSRLPNNHQIGIRGTMIITAAVAAVLGGSTFRADGQISIKWEVVRELGFLASSGVILALPLGAAMLLLQKRHRAIGAIAVIFSFATALDGVVAAAALSYGPIDLWLCCAVSLLNLVQTAWIIGTLTVLRFGGYRVLRVEIPGSDPALARGGASAA
jgi:hypothetical protein